MSSVEIRVRGHMAEHWSDWFGDLTIEHIENETMLSGDVADQAAVYGHLAKLRDLGLVLISVKVAGEEL